MKDKTIFIKNIYYMLAYAFQALNQPRYDKIASETFDNIYDLFAAILSAGVARRLKTGLYREYIETAENLSVLRGRLDIRSSLANRLQKRRRLACEFDELSENNLYNQIIKTTLNLLIKRKDVKAEYKNSLKKEAAFLGSIEEIDPSSVRWNSLKFDRANQSYEALLGVCRFALAAVLPSSEKGKYRFANFFGDAETSRLYEKFILEYYRKEFPQLKANPSQIKWRLAEGEDGALLPLMQTDVTLSYKGKKLVIDAKYYSRATQTNLYGNRKFHSNNLYQIFTYVKNMDVGDSGNVSGILLYAQTDEEISPNCEYTIGGNKIGVKTLDLNRNFSEIAAQLNQLAINEFGLEK